MVARPESAAGFALAGLATDEARTAREGAERIVALAAREEVGVLLVEEDLLEALDEPVRRQLLRRPTPIIVPFPRPTDRQRRSAADAYILELLQRAIGYHVRLQ